jgi:hypothetical protein
MTTHEVLLELQKRGCNTLDFGVQENKKDDDNNNYYYNNDKEES